MLLLCCSLLFCVLFSITLEKQITYIFFSCLQGCPPKWVQNSSGFTGGAFDQLRAHGSESMGGA